MPFVFDLFMAVRQIEASVFVVSSSFDMSQLCGTVVQGECNHDLGTLFCELW